MGVGSRRVDNDNEPNVFRNWTAPNIEEVTINVVPSGTETDSVKFFNKGRQGNAYTIVADKDMEITEITHGGNAMHIGDAIPVSADTRVTRKTYQPPFTQIKLNVLATNTNIQLWVF